MVSFYETAYFVRIKSDFDQVSGAVFRRVYENY